MDAARAPAFGGEMDLTKQRGDSGLSTSSRKDFLCHLGIFSPLLCWHNSFLPRLGSTL